MRAKNMKLFAVIICFVLLLCNAAYGDEVTKERPAHWATPMQVEGVPNLFKVSDTLYRSAQPSADGLANLKAMGIKTVLNLRTFHSDRDEIGNSGLAYEHIYMKTWHPEEEDAVKFLQIVTNPKQIPVLVHCQHGADRTGIMCALYRVAVQNWNKEAALAEMTQGGFGFHEIWQNLPVWLENLEIEAIRKKAGINPDTQSENLSGREPK